MGSRNSPPMTTSARLENQALDLAQVVLDPCRDVAFVLAVSHRRQVHHDVGGGPARRRLAEEGGHVQVA
jgi:hypothetical protein